MGRPGSYTSQKPMPCEATKDFHSQAAYARHVQDLRLLLPSGLIHLYLQNPHLVKQQEASQQVQRQLHAPAVKPAWAPI